MKALEIIWEHFTGLCDILGTAAILLSLPILLILAGYWPLAILYFIGLGAIL